MNKETLTQTADYIDSTVTEFPIVENEHHTLSHSYYRSTAFIPTISVNPLTAVASPLLSLTARLRETATHEDLHSLYQYLVHEINAFENNAQKQGYRSETILVARYLLCATLDETILNAVWGKQSVWNNLLLLNTFHGEKTANERFFLILERISENPLQHIELLELMYLCLSEGFQGKYRYDVTGKATLDNIIDDLYQLIRSYRTDPTPLIQMLPVEEVSSQVTKTSKGPQKNSIIHTLLKSIATAVLILFLLYFGLSYFMWKMSYAVYKDLQKVEVKNQVYKENQP